MDTARDERPETPPGLERWKTLVPLCVGLLCVLVAAGLLALVPGTVAEREAYAAAPVCAAGEPRSGDCTTTLPATVEAKEDVRSGKSIHHELTLAEREGPGNRTHRLRMIGSAPVYDTVRTGDEVTFTYWRGEILTVRFGDAAQETERSPADDWRVPVAAGLLLLPFGLILLWAVWWYRYRYRSSAAPARTAHWTFALWPVAGSVMACAGCVAGLEAASITQAFVVTAAALPPALGLGALCGWWTQRRSARAADTSDIVPVPVRERRCVSATVHGDVPYSVAGFGVLVLGDGRPAATPDPDGRVARRVLPKSLTVRGVRSLHRPGDPDGWYTTYGYDAAVIECVDEDRPVLIATHRREAGAILGALNPDAA
ncbi:hypothetical protein [Streptomyces sp. ITFR-16]|uniref:hypothetical protein n=1 Tax=Streptomyces sp. ITFR-16 TaxID=3075198 RepID=UPI00288BFA8E|nr:hypothetical protein [Streptomyces sp. ITFR-16]WNI25007.1 hypothetical protein RLT58_25365 [Streptomyces sp. ITFR-16]